jgi:hypothetical protein
MQREAITGRRRVRRAAGAYLPRLLLVLMASCTDSPGSASTMKPSVVGGSSGMTASHAGTTGPPGASHDQSGTSAPASGGAGAAPGAAGAGGATAGVGGHDASIDAAHDAGADAASEAPGCSGESFCESFDAMPGPQIDGARWELVTPNCSGDGEVAIDGEVAHSSTQSLRVRGGAGYCNHVFIRPLALLGALPDPLHARFFVRLDAPLASAHVTFLALHDAVEAKDLRMGGQSEILMWNRESDDATLPELSPTGIAASVRPSAQTWICIELMIDAAGQTLSTWVDGQAVPGLQVEGDATPDIDAQWRRKSDYHPQLQDVKLGWESYGDGTNTLWFDDVAVGAARFGCTP